MNIPAFSHDGFSGLIGVAREDITPPVGIYARNWGAAKHDVAEGIHRPLTATVLTLQAEESDSPLVLVSYDLGWWKTIEDEWFLRGGLIEALSLDPARVMMNLSHTHSCPSVCRDDAHQPGGHLIASYLEKVKQTMIAATRRALEARTRATLAWSYGKCDLATNRDLVDPERPRVVCGFNSSAEADDTLLVGRVTDASGKIVATLANYACHPTTLAWQNKLISTDYIGAMREIVEPHTGGAPCLFLQGASGELSPREQYTGDTTIADAHGRKLGHAILSVLEGMLPHQTQLAYAGVVESGAPLATWKRSAYKPARTLEAIQLTVDLTLKDLPGIAEIEQQMKTTTDRALAERLTRQRRVRRLVGNGQSAPRPLWVWRVGDSFLLGQPDEAYSWLQIEPRRRFPNRAIVVMNLVNGSLGYQPPQNLYGQDLYQVWQTPFAAGCLEQTLAAAEGAIRAMTSDSSSQ